MQNGLAFLRRATASILWLCHRRPYSILYFVANIPAAWVVDAARDHHQYNNVVAESIVPSTRTVVTLIYWPGPACMLLAG